jgi:hypothetical protein
VDLFYRSGINLELLLSDLFVESLEKIGHHAAAEECGLIDKSEAVRECRQVVAQFVKDSWPLDEVTNYLEGRSSFISALATPLPALHRGDLFLFSLCVLNISAEKLRQLVVIWFALISLLLMLDDAEDLNEDKESGDENAFIQSGLSPEGFARIQALVTGSLEQISRLNTVMATTLQRTFAGVPHKPGIKEYLNN